MLKEGKAFSLKNVCMYVRVCMCACDTIQIHIQICVCVHLRMCECIDAIYYLVSEISIEFMENAYYGKTA